MLPGITADQPLTKREQARSRAAARRALRTSTGRAAITVAVFVPLSALGAAITMPGLSEGLLMINVLESALCLGVAMLAFKRRESNPLALAFAFAWSLVATVLLLMLFAPAGRVTSLMTLTILPPAVALFLPWGVRAHAVWLLASTVALVSFTLSPAASDPAAPPTDWASVWNALLLSGFASLVGSSVAEGIRRRLFLREMQARRSHFAIRVREAELVRLTRELEQITLTDLLTGLGNRLRLNQELDSAVARLARYGSTCALAVVDLDHFKAYNDALGHLAGDDALRDVAAVLRSSVRDVDTVCRFGGEEFVVVMPEQTLEGGRRAAERLRVAVEALGLRHPTSSGERVLTISAGVALLGRDEGVEHDVDALLQAADAALYRAKEAGRNRVAL